jgi:signal transduction histidine kinase
VSPRDEGRPSSAVGTVTAKEEAPARISILRFLVAFAAVALCFMSATAYTQLVQASINEDVQGITANAGPSIEHLSRAQAELRHIHTLLHLYVVGREHDATELEEIDRARKELRAEVRAYVALPAFSEEPPLWHEAERTLAELEELHDTIIGDLAQDDFPAADTSLRRDLPPLINRAAATISATVDYNAAEASRLAAQIEHTRSRAQFIASVLDGISAVLALLAASLLFRGVRQYTALIEAHQRLTDQRAEELEQFAGRVAHDILSPLSATAMALAIADRSTENPAKVHEALTRGERGLQRVRSIVAALLQFAQAGARPAPRADLAVTLDEVLSDLRADAQKAGIDLAVEPFSTCDVRCSPGILMSLLSNLLRNAIKYMGECEERRISVRVRERGAGVRVEIADTGPGIPEHICKTIFEPYVRGETTGQPGIGLGLATVKRLAMTHGGDAGVRSVVGRGSVFWFELPRSAAEPAPEASTQPATL